MGFFVAIAVIVGARHRAAQDDPRQVCRGDRRQPHRGGTFRHQPGQVGLDSVRDGRVLRRAAGVARASYMSLGDPLSGDQMELNCIIAVLLGGTAFSGGEGSVAKSMIGALIIMCVTTGLMTVIPAYWQTVAKGVVLLFAVVLNHLLVRARQRREQRDA